MKAKTAWEALQQGILICNKHGQIIYFNDLYEQYLGIPLEEAKGKPISNYRETSVVKEVIGTGKAKEGLQKTEKGMRYYASVYPIFENQEVTGSISIVTSLKQKHSGSSGKLTLAERVRQFEQEEILLCCEKYGMNTEGKRLAAEELGISLATLYNKLGEKK